MAVKLKDIGYLVRYKRVSRSRKNYRTWLLFDAVTKGDEAQVRQLLKDGGVRINALASKYDYPRDIAIYDNLLMVNAIHNDCAAITRMLIQAGCRLNTKCCRGLTALHLAVWLQHNEVARELIRSGANVRASSEYGSALLFAVLCENHNRDLLFEYFPRASPYPYMLYGAPLFGFLYATKFVYQAVQARNVDVRRLYGVGFAYFRSIDLGLIKLLLDAGADINQKDGHGCSAIHYAAFLKDNLEPAKHLIEAGADINSLNSINASALHNAVLSNNEEMVLLLLSRGADVSVKTRPQGDTSLHLAAMIGRRRSHGTIKRYLIDFGSDVNEKNSEGKTSVELELAYEGSAIVKYVAEVEVRTNARVFDEHNLAVIEKWKEVNDSYEKCKAELKLMSNDKIGNTLIDYFSLLTKPLKVVARYARNEEFVNGFKASDLQIDRAYPIYASRLRKNFNAAIARQKTVEQICTILSKTLRFADPSDRAFEIIFEYLTEEDVNRLIDWGRKEKLI